MQSVACDQCGISNDRVDRLNFQLSYRGSMSGSTWDFCSEACVFDWAIAQLRRERDDWRDIAQREQEKNRGKR